MKPARMLLAALALVALVADARAGDWQTFVDRTRADRWTGLDKGMHFGAGVGVSVVGLAVTRNEHKAFALGVGVAAAKELYDLRHLKRHSPSGKDFAVTVIGAAAGAYVPGLILGPGFIGYSRSF